MTEKYESKGLECPECANEDHVLGYQVREVYDGILFWVCGFCGHAWPREFGIPVRDRFSRAYVAGFLAGKSDTVVSAFQAELANREA